MAIRRHILVGVPLGLGGAVVVLGLLLLWGAAVAALADDPTGGPVLVGTYLGFALAGPVVVLGAVLGLGALQRLRFGTLLGVDIPAPRRSWYGPAAWRQIAYLLLAPVLALACLPGLVAGGARFARVDASLGRRLLGAGRADALTQRIATLSRSRADVVAATDAERRRIERDLHDGAQQRLVSLAMNLGMARAALTGETPGPVRQAIADAHDEATLALAELREFVRGLHPVVLDDRGLDAALSGIAARSPVPVRLTVDVAGRCDPSIEAVAYFVVSEALANIARHSRAARAWVAVVRTADRLRVTVTDDGVGGADPGAGTGLRGLAQRTAAVDGTLTVASPRGGPTTISVDLPCGS
jgi:signal transduction histidine kinase